MRGAAAKRATYRTGTWGAGKLRGIQKVAPLVGVVSLLLAAGMLIVDVRAWLGMSEIPEGFNAVFATGFGVTALTWLVMTFASQRLDQIERRQAQLEQHVDTIEQNVNTIAETIREVSDVLETLSRQVAAHAGLMTAVPEEYTRALCEMRELLSSSYRTLFTDAAQAMGTRRQAAGEHQPRLGLVPHRPN
jgi:hypothetical protein